MRGLTLGGAVVALGLVATACASREIVVTAVGPGSQGFVLHVVDSRRDAGVGLSLAVDPDGAPHLAYLVLEDPPESGEVPPPPDPMLPAVRHAQLSQGFWSRAELAHRVEVGRGDATAVAVDAQGTSHVVWTAAGELRYARFGGEPETVASGGIVGPSIAIGQGGAPWVAFYQDDTVKAAARTERGWTVEDVAAAGEEPATPSTALAAGPSGLLVAYTDGSRAMVARRTPPGWATEVIDENGGPVALALDPAGGPHLAYVTPGGDVQHAHPGGVVALTVSRLSEPPGPGSTVALAVGPDLVHHLAWADDGRIVYANDRTGTFDPLPVPGSEGGTGPRLAVGKEEAVYLAWYNAEDGRADLGTRTAMPADTLLAAPASPATQPPEPRESPGVALCEPDGTALAIAASPGAAATGFDQNCLAVPAGQAFTIEFDNQDPGIPHNVAIYRDETATEALFVGEIFPGPDRRSYGGDALQAGQYFFRCDVHPTTMTGAFVVA